MQVFDHQVAGDDRNDKIDLSLLSAAWLFKRLVFANNQWEVAEFFHWTLDFS